MVDGDKNKYYHLNLLVSMQFIDAIKLNKDHKNMYNKITSVLPTGFGALVPKEQFFLLTAIQVRMLMIRQGFIIVKNVNFDDENKFRKLIGDYGIAVEYTGRKKNVGYGYKDILKLDGEKNKIITGRGELPLHADGGLLQTRVDLIFLYAVKVKNMLFQGATAICDHELAYQEMPYHLKRILDEEVFEAKILEKDYYGDAAPDDWFVIPVYTDYYWGRAMMIYFPFTDNNPPNWESRIVGFTAQENKAFFDELKSFLTQPRYYYKHFWNKGDLVIMDNRRVIHARDPYSEEGERVLYRGQTTDF